MVLKAKVLREFVAKDGKKVVLREPRWEDLDDLLDFINSLVKEGADIMRETPVTREEEADWLGKRLASIEKGEIIGVVAEADGKVVANSEVMKRRGPLSHVGVLGIAVKKGYRGIGIGEELMKTLIEESRKAGIKVLVLEVSDFNRVAKSLYAKMGFKDAGRIPKGFFRKGKYVDLLRMTLEL
jgi:L-amino acid N-acyltransferase YncA